MVPFGLPKLISDPNRTYCALAFAIDVTILWSVCCLL